MPNSAGLAQLLCASALAFLCAACEPDDRPSRRDFGYLEVKGTFELRGGDGFAFAGTPIKKNAAGRLEGLIKAPLGKNDLVLQRDARSYVICDASIRKNRITSVLVQNGPRGLTCTVKE